MSSSISEAAVGAVGGRWRRCEETLIAARLSTFTVKALKNELRDRNLHVTGVREDLANRLAASQKGLKETRK